MYPDDWMKASDYNNLRQAINSGHRHTGGSDGPQLTMHSVAAYSITRDRFQTREKYIFTPCVVAKSTGVIISPTLDTGRNWGYDIITSGTVDIAATFAQPYDMVDYDIDIFLHVNNFAEPISASASEIVVKVANASGVTTYTVDLSSYQEMIFVGQRLIDFAGASVTITPKSQPASISVFISEFSLSGNLLGPAYPFYVNGIMLKYTSRP